MCKSLVIGFIFLSVVFSAHANTYAVFTEKGELKYTDTPPCTEEITIPVKVVTVTAEQIQKVKTALTLEDHIQKAAEMYTVDPALVKAVIKVESRYQRKAISPKGCKGYMQINPVNYQVLKITDPFDPWQNIRGGTAYLGYCLLLFKGDLIKTLAAYNAGYQTVQAYGGIPPYQETQRYVQAVLAEYKRYLKCAKYPS